MALFFRSATRRRLLFVCVSLVVGVYLSFQLVYQFRTLGTVPVHQEPPDKRQNIEYTLPSLDDVMNSEIDLDLQRVLASFKSLHDMIPKDTPRLKIVIVSTWRSGSTLLGEIISSHPGSFYHYEPLMSYGMKQIGQDESKKATDLISDLLDCNYSDKTKYLNYAYGNPEMFVRNAAYWRMCSALPRFKCYVPENIHKLCSLFPLKVMKLVRVRLSTLAPLLESKNTKVIWLTRDPRAVMNSRLSSVTWCTSKSCKEPYSLCNDILDDFNSYSELKSKYNDQLMILRYEDLANDPYRKTEDVLEFLGLSVHPNVTSYLVKHLNNDFEAPWSTIHNPQRQARKWLKNAPWNTVVYTQYYCRPVMKLLGYRAFEKEEELSAENAVQILNVP